MSQRLTVPVEIKVLNKKDFSYNTALHLAAYKNGHLAVRLLLDCLFLERNEVNGDGLKFLDILRNQGQNESGWDLDLEQVVLKTGCNEATSDFSISPITFWRYCSAIMRRLRSNISDVAHGVFLVVCTLIITATYQTAVQPPGGVHQSEDANVGSVVMKQTFFIFLWVSNTVVFCCAVIYTFCLTPLGNMFATWFFWIGTCLCTSYALAMAVISPHPLVFLSATFAFFMLFALGLLLDVFENDWQKHRT